MDSKIDKEKANALRTELQQALGWTGAGFVLEANEFFHTALIDAKACAHVWRYCEKMDLPSDSIELDLVLRRDVEQLLTLAQKDENEDNKVEVPLPF